MGPGQQSGQELTLWIVVAVLAMVGLAVLVILVSRMATNRILQEQEKLRQAESKHQRELLQSNIQVQERERKRLAAELHDELSSMLNILKLQLYSARKALPDADATLQLVDDSIEVSRNVSHDLYPPLLADLGLLEALSDFLQPLQQQLRIDIAVSGPNRIEPPVDASLQLFRIVQELTSNAIKHAQCSTLLIRVRLERGYTALLVRDDGQGFDPQRAYGGLGMQNIESRVQVLNGRHRMRSAPGRGTSTIVIIPTT